MAVILPDGDHINDTASFGSRFAPEIYQVPLGPRAPTIRDEPLRHRACPFCRMVGFLARTHFFRLPYHDLGSERGVTGRQAPFPADPVHAVVRLFRVPCLKHTKDQPLMANFTISTSFINSTVMGISAGVCPPFTTAFPSPS